MAFKDYNYGWLDNPPVEKKKEDNTKPDEKKPVDTTTNTVSAPVQAPSVQVQTAQTTGYVAPSKKLTMPNTNAYDAASPDAYNSRWQSQIDDLMGQIMNRGKFSYDLDGDMLYQQYKNQYQLLGNQAMQDTMGQAAGLTGGYGSTYSQNAGQQAYNAYLQQLNDKVPELYGMALDQYNQEGANMRSNLSMLNQAEDSDYGRYNDNYNRWLAERQHAEERDDLAWNREYQFQKDQLALQDDNYNRLASLISTYGYNPSDEELAAAGLSRSISDMMRNKYIEANTPKASVAPVYKDNNTPNQGSINTYGQLSSLLENALKSGVSKKEVKKTYEENIDALIPPGTPASAAAQIKAGIKKNLGID